MANDFPSTHWSLVSAARGSASEQALATLCEAYWYPLYAFVRRYGHDRDEALDLTQGFFTVLLEKRYLDDLRPGEGRFRSFLLSAMKHHISKQRARDRAEKRGGGRSLSRSTSMKPNNATGSNPPTTGHPKRPTNAPGP